MENTEQFDIPYINLDVKALDILNLLGYVDKSAPLEVLKDVKQMMRTIPGYVDAKCGYKYLFNENCVISDNSFSIGNITFKTGKIIAPQLMGSSSIAIIVSTAGPSVTQFSSDLIKDGEYLKGYITDAIGSIVAERAADFAENEIKILAESSGNKISNRLSPGYCGWDVSEQFKLFSLLPDNFCGITLTESALMVPIKSISAVIGIGKNVQKGEYPCSDCTRDDCFKKGDRHNF